jgi:hypothetical protein
MIIFMMIKILKIIRFGLMLLDTIKAIKENI